MKEGKDIVDITASFVAGIASGSLILRLGGSAYTSASIAVILLSSSLFILWKSGCLEKRPAVRKNIFLQGLLFLTGLSCLFSAKISAGFSASDPLFYGQVRQAAVYLSETIEELPHASAESKAMMKALILGDKCDLDREVVQAFRESGAAHILALSGLHLGILYLLINRFLKFFGNFPVVRLSKAIVILLVTGVYVLATGASPSLIRAFLFILLNETAQLLHRRTRLSTILCSALFIQLVLDPLAIENVGFQLSYLAMAGICWIHPVLKVQDLHFPFLQKIWDTASLTLSCQVLTAPVVLYHFGTFPQYFLITNLLALPLTTLVMVVSLLQILLGCMKIFPTFLSEIGNHIIHLLIYIIETISHI